MFEPTWKTLIRNSLAFTLIVGGFLWVSADDWEAELEQEQRIQQQRQAREELQALADQSQKEPEFEPDWTSVVAPIHKATQTIKKSTVKAKRKIKPKKS